jgi:uncharacterized protein YgbK (DUF1537 family)
MTAQAPAAPVPWGPVPPLPETRGTREEIRHARARRPRSTVVLDDDPTGSQSVHGLEIVTQLHEAEYRPAMDDPAGAFFVLTNSRSLPEPDAAALDERVADDLFRVAADTGRSLELVSRSDSTLRGHVISEVRALDAAHRRAGRGGYHAVLLAPAFLEAGRVTAADTHWARAGSQFLPVGETEFARDAVFGYRSSDLRDFIAELTGGEIPASQVGSIGLSDLREHGPQRVAEIIASAPAGGFIVVNALDYADLEIAALGALQAEAAGAGLLYRTGPSFVRALTGQEPSPPLTGAQIWPDGRVPGHGLIVVGSHVGQTSRQLSALEADGDVSGVELDVPALLAADEPAARRLIADTAARVTSLLSGTDVVLFTSRTLIADGDRSQNLQVSRRVSEAVSAIVRHCLDAGPVPAWVVAKGGITSHDVAIHGLGIRRAEVAGQFFTGMVSLFRPVAADNPGVLGRPYVVFAGNVGDDLALAQVVARLRGGS